MDTDLLVAGPSYRLGLTVRLVADHERAVGRWPSLVVDGLPTFQIDLPREPTDERARVVVHGLAAAVAERGAAIIWKVAAS